MPIRWSDFTFNQINDYHKPTIYFKEEYGCLLINLQIRSWPQPQTTLLHYECMGIEHALPRLLEAFIDITPGYAGIDKYFHYIRTRSRCDHNAESRGTVRWDLSTSGFDRFEILVRNNFEMSTEQLIEYNDDADPRSLAIKGDVWLNINIKQNLWFTTLIAGLDDLLQNTPDTPVYPRGWCKAQFPFEHYNKIKRVLEIPDGPHKEDQLRDGKNFWDNTDGIVIQPEEY